MRNDQCMPLENYNLHPEFPGILICKLNTIYFGGGEDKYIEHCMVKLLRMLIFLLSVHPLLAQSLLLSHAYPIPLMTGLNQ